MNRLLFVAAFAVTAFGCKASSDATVARNYPCDGGFADTSQCQGGWVCSREGVCIDPLLPTARGCASDTECSGWRCGRDAVCFNPAVKVARPCADDSECFGWRCSPPAADGLGRCYDRAVALDVSCRADAGATAGDCRDDFRCGLEDRCYNPADAGSVLCDQDEDCAFPEWRCAVTQPRRCTKVSEEALVERPPSSVVVFLKTPWVAPTYQKDNFLWIFGLGDPFNTLFLGGVADGGRIEVANTTTGAQSLYTPDAGVVQAVTPYGALINGNLQTGFVQLRDAGTFLASAGSDFLVAWTSDGFLAHSNSGIIATQYVPGPPAPIKKLVLPPSAVNSPGRYGVFALTDNGVYHVAHTGTSYAQTWKLLDFPNLPHRYCTDAGWAPSNVPTDIAAVMYQPSDIYNFTLISVGPQDGGVTAVANRLTLNFGPGPAFDCIDNWRSLTAPTAACIPGQSPVRAFSFGEQSYGFDCRASDAGANVPYSLAIYDVIPSPVVYRFPSEGLPAQYEVIPHRTAGFASTGSAALHSAEGNLYTMQATGRDFRPEWFSGAPIATAFAADGGVLVLDGLKQLNGVPRIYGEDSALGLMPSRTTFQAPLLCSGVDGPGRWNISRGNFLDLSSLLEVHPAADLTTRTATTPPSWGSFEGAAPLMSALCDRHHPRALHPLIRNANDLARTPYLLMAGVDRIWAGPTSLLDPLVPGTFPVVAVPAPSTRIDSLTFVEPRPGQAELFVGYALAQERLFEIRAESATRWISTELPVPAGKPIAVFSQGSRARLGFDDGRVLSLPGLVPLAPAVGDRVTKYGVLCGRVYATSRNAFHRLGAVSGQVLGSWSPFGAPTVRPPTTKRDRFARAAMAVDGNMMYVADDVGTVFTVIDQTCSD